MATVTFNIPGDVKEAFTKAFEDQDKSAIITEFMREAVERQERRKRHVDAIDRILARRKHAPPITEEEFRQSQGQGWC